MVMKYSTFRWVWERVVPDIGQLPSISPVHTEKTLSPLDDRVQINLLNTVDVADAIDEENEHPRVVMHEEEEDLGGFARM